MTTALFFFLLNCNFPFFLYKLNTKNYFQEHSYIQINRFVFFFKEYFMSKQTTKRHYILMMNNLWPRQLVWLPSTTLRVTFWFGANNIVIKEVLDIPEYANHSSCLHFNEECQSTNSCMTKKIFWFLTLSLTKCIPYIPLPLPDNIYALNLDISIL